MCLENWNTQKMLIVPKKFNLLIFFSLRDFYRMKNDLYHTTNIIKIFLMGVHYFIKRQKIACLHSLCSASPRKNNFFQIAYSSKVSLGSRNKELIFGGREVGIWHLGMVQSFDNGHPLVRNFWAKNTESIQISYSLFNLFFHFDRLASVSFGIALSLVHFQPQGNI